MNGRLGSDPSLVSQSRLWLDLVNSVSVTLFNMIIMDLSVDHRDRWQRRKKSFFSFLFFPDGLYSFFFPDSFILSFFPPRVGNILTKPVPLRIKLNIDGVPIVSRSHTHPSHSQTSRLLTSSLSSGVPSPDPPSVCDVCRSLRFRF